MKGTSNACLAPLQKKGGATIFSQFFGESYIGGGGCYKTPVNMLLYKVNTNKTIDHLMQYFWQSRKFIEKIRALQENNKKVHWHYSCCVF